MENHLIERYIQQFETTLGNDSKRKDIVQELRSNIDEMLEAYDVQDEAAVRAVLTELGDPIKLAYSYSGKPYSLISGQYFTVYKMVLKYVAFAVLLGAIVAAIVNIVMGIPSEDRFQALYDIVPSLLAAVGAVTVIFYFIERSGKSLDSKAWQIEDLPEFISKSKIIPLSEAITGLVISTIFYFVGVLAPRIPIEAIYIEGMPLRIFDYSAWLNIIPFFTLIYVASLVKHIVMLLVRKYGLKVGLTTIVVDLIQLATFAWLILKSPMFDNAALNALNEQIKNPWSLDRQKYFLLGIFTVIYIIEIVVVSIKSFKAERNKLAL